MVSVKSPSHRLFTDRSPRLFGQSESFGGIGEPLITVYVDRARRRTWDRSRGCSEWPEELARGYGRVSGVGRGEGVTTTLYAPH